MTQKRYCKLLRAYFTRLHESSIKAGGSGLPLGMIYKCICKFPSGMTRDEWCKNMSQQFELFNIGKKDT